ncbi:hypothetical protein FHR32_001594 [Streptosporangium album]|uniref:Uncharacterized protein n=1 Tax=Streptosporangium album TaxID=47479 RepID=A0A7W7W8P0_9ACTN|nr:hypothetical protein [Streptosporangium album]MBB4937289.1 hypothetical protein [Streptosporangium album]
MVLRPRVRHGQETGRLRPAAQDGLHLPYIDYTTLHLLSYDLGGKQVVVNLAAID